MPQTYILHLVGLSYPEIFCCHVFPRVGSGCVYLQTDTPAAQTATAETDDPHSNECRNARAYLNAALDVQTLTGNISEPVVYLSMIRELEKCEGIFMHCTL